MSGAGGGAMRGAARRGAALALAVLLLGGCETTLERLGDGAGPPKMTPSGDPTKDPKYRPISLPMPDAKPVVASAASLWRSGGRAFFPDQRAASVGDIVTVLVNITDAADVKNNTTATRAGNEAMATPNLFGLEHAIPRILPHADPASLVGTTSNNANTGTAEIKRSETITLRVAGVITQVLPNGNLAVAARQQVRVGAELRELTVSGVIRPQDIASDNTVPHDRLAEARISYGGRGQLTDVQTPRYGQQMMDILLPF
jgi:flagellar L-ring protein precursor FlgH